MRHLFQLIIIGILFTSNIVYGASDSQSLEANAYHSCRTINGLCGYSFRNSKPDALGSPTLGIVNWNHLADGGQYPIDVRITGSINTLYAQGFSVGNPSHWGASFTLGVIAIGTNQLNGSKEQQFIPLYRDFVGGVRGQRSTSKSIVDEPFSLNLTATLTKFPLSRLTSLHFSGRGLTTDASVSITMDADARISWSQTGNRFVTVMSVVTSQEGVIRSGKNANAIKKVVREIAAEEDIEVFNESYMISNDTIKQLDNVINALPPGPQASDFLTKARKMIDKGAKMIEVLRGIHFGQEDYGTISGLTQQASEIVAARARSSGLGPAGRRIVWEIRDSIEKQRPVALITYSHANLTAKKVYDALTPAEQNWVFFYHIAPVDMRADDIPFVQYTLDRHDVIANNPLNKGNLGSNVNNGLSFLDLPTRALYEGATGHTLSGHYINRTKNAYSDPTYGVHHQIRVLLRGTAGGYFPL